jgi:hypothetical protein
MAIEAALAVTGASEFSSAFKDIAASLKAFAAESDLAIKSIGSSDSLFSGLTNAASALEKEYANLSKSAGDLQDKMAKMEGVDKLSSMYNKFAAELATVQSAMLDNRSTFETTQIAMESLGAAANMSADELKSLGKDGFGDIATNSDRAATSLDKLGIDLGEVGTNAKNAAGELSNTGESFNVIEGAAGKITGTFDALKANFANTITIFNGIKDAIGGVIDFIKNLANAILDIGKAVFNTLSDIWKGAEDMALKAANFEQTIMKVEDIISGGKGGNDLSAKAIKELSDSILTLGVSSDTALNAFSSFFSVLKNRGVSEAQAYALSMQMVQRATDLGASANLSFEDTYQKLLGALSTKTSRQLTQDFGISWTAESLLDFAKVEGIATKNAKALDLEQQALSLTMIMLKQSGYAAGQYADEMGNLDSILRLRPELIKEIQRELGTSFVDFFAEWEGALNDFLRTTAKSLSDGFQISDIDTVLDAGVTLVKSWAKTITDNAPAFGEALASVVRKAADFIKSDDFAGMVSAVRGAFDTIAAAVHDSGLGEAIGELFGSLKDKVLPLVTEAASMIRMQLAPVAYGLRSALIPGGADYDEAVAQYFATLKKQAEDGVKAITDSTSSAWGNFALMDTDDFGDNLSKINQHLVTTFTSIESFVNSIDGLSPAVAEAMTNFFKSIHLDSANFNEVDLGDPFVLQQKYLEYLTEAFSGNGISIDELVAQSLARDASLGGSTSKGEASYIYKNMFKNIIDKIPTLKDAFKEEGWDGFSFTIDDESLKITIGDTSATLANTTSAWNSVRMALGQSIETTAKDTPINVEQPIDVSIEIREIKDTIEKDITTWMEDTNLKYFDKKNGGFGLAFHLDATAIPEVKELTADQFADLITAIQAGIDDDPETMDVVINYTALSKLTGTTIPFGDRDAAIAALIAYWNAAHPEAEIPTTGKINLKDYKPGENIDGNWNITNIPNVTAETGLIVSVGETQLVLREGLDAQSQQAKIAAWADANGITSKDAVTLQQGYNLNYIEKEATAGTLTQTAATSFLGGLGATLSSKIGDKLKKLIGITDEPVKVDQPTQVNPTEATPLVDPTALATMDTDVETAMEEGLSDADVSVGANLDEISVNPLTPEQLEAYSQEVAEVLKGHNVNAEDIHAIINELIPDVPPSALDSLTARIQELLAAYNASSFDTSNAAGGIVSSLGTNLASADTTPIKTGLETNMRAGVGAVLLPEAELIAKAQEMGFSLETGAAGTSSNVSAGLTTSMSVGTKGATVPLEDAKKLGYNVGSGIATGVTSSQSIISNAVNAVIKNALKAAQNTNQVKSPSRLWAKELGRPLGLGAAMGLLETAPEFQKAAEQFAVPVWSDVIDPLTHFELKGGEYRVMMDLDRKSMKSIQNLGNTSTNVLLNGRKVGQSIRRYLPSAV